MEPRYDTTAAPSISQKSEAALQWLGVGVSHPIRVLMRLHKDLAFELIQGEQIRVSLGDHLVADDLVHYLPQGITLNTSNREVLLSRDAPVGREGMSADQAVDVRTGDSDLKMPKRPIRREANSDDGPIRSVSRPSIESTVASVDAPPYVGGREEEIREACEALRWVAGERKVLRGAVAKGVTLHLEVFERASGGSLELRDIDSVDHRALLSRLGFRPTSSSAWCAEWKKLPSERDASEQIATVSLGRKPSVRISFE